MLHLSCGERWDVLCCHIPPRCLEHVCCQLVPPSSNPCVRQSKSPHTSQVAMHVGIKHRQHSSKGVALSVAAW